MAEIKCPNCGTVISLEQSDLDSVVRQVRDEEFARDLAERTKLLEAEKDQALKLAQVQSAAELREAQSEAAAALKQVQAQSDAALKQAQQTAKPSMRQKAATFEYWQRLGYKDDPAKVNAAAIDALTFADIEKFYEDNVKGKPVTIILMGDPKKIDKKAIEQKVGCKITTVSPAKLFNSVDELYDAVM